MVDSLWLLLNGLKSNVCYNWWLILILNGLLSVVCYCWWLCIHSDVFILNLYDAFVWRSSLVVSPWCCHDVGLSMVSQVVQPETNYVFVCYLNHKIKRFFWLTDLRMDSNGAFQSMIKSSVHWINSLTAQVNVLCVISFWVVCIIVLAAIFVLLFWLLSSLASYTEVHVTCYSVFHLYHQRNVICGQFL